MVACVLVDATPPVPAAALACRLTILNAGEAVLQTTATPIVPLFFLFLFLLRYAST